MKQRMMSVAGSFYPNEPHAIEEMIAHFNSILDAHPELADRFDSLRGRAVIVPHAGWVYSGFTANIAYRILKHNAPKTVVVIGPSHRVGFDGISIADVESYQTPLGNLDIDQETVRNLRERFSLHYHPDGHHEHSTEVQMPFLKYYLPETRVVELVYAYADSSMVAPIIDSVLNDPDAAVVISTDLSHFYTLEEAKRLDSICLEAIRDTSIARLYQGCEACGMIGVEAMIDVARKRDMHSTLLDYRTSADASHDTSRVVGYTSALFHFPI
ncbi:MAG: AmmeMemoRadiSam system protein B [Sulfuricurvum sp.]|nr:AmmeMemoRadiSam system protein B [Sulfuricurvum sp.]